MFCHEVTSAGQWGQDLTTSAVWTWITTVLDVRVGLGVVGVFIGLSSPMCEDGVLYASLHKGFAYF